MSTISILDEIIGKIKNTKTVIKKLQEDKKQLQEIIKKVVLKNNANQIMNDTTNIDKIVGEDFNIFDMMCVPDEAFITTKFESGLHA
jgi:hypothetical protein